MKKMYFLTISLIIVITAGFLIFSNDINGLNEKFLSSFGIIIDPDPVSFENIVIPEEFDDIYKNYNMMQIECGLDLSPHKGKSAVRYTYKVLNFPDADTDILANVICIKHRPAAGDLMNPAVDGFIQPLNFIENLNCSER